MRGTDSGGSPPRREESEDFGKAIVPYVSPQDDSRKVDTQTSSQDVPSGVKDRDDLLRWARDEDAAEKEADRAQAEETVGERSTDAPTSAEEEAATILSEVLGDLHRHAEAPIETEHVTAPVITSSATSDSSHSSDEIPLKDRVAQIAKGKKVASEKKAQSRKKTQKKEKVSKRKSFSDPEVEASPRYKRRCTEAAKQGEKPSASSKKEKKKKATQQAKDSDEDRFYDKASKKKFESVEGRGVVVERMIDEGAFEKYGLTELLQQKSLYKSATFPESYSLSLVQEFYSNLLPSDKGITRVYVRGKWIPFTPTCLNKFLEFKPEVKGNYEEGLVLNEEVLKEITRGRTESWGEETRLPASNLTAKYNILFRLGIQNWLPAPHNSNIVKELALLLFAVGTGKKFNLGRLIFQNIVKEVDRTSSSTSLGYPADLSARFVTTWSTTREGRSNTRRKKSKISQKLSAQVRRLIYL
ncbi:uncharacterized protein LOC120281046 [Dioscorea cayenensis subsp. rotundata]|uniref:Uncharacterized protein LOC120281046 n=1 Tax=Dioscorea cayennensis subsp. rotundata TaxID=55577 RepID=A0AB40CXJ6_DIOCR|nr:uncharacterized protein LOC120281046 [Dioscorea cayenensis subsp. rotundata]